MITTKAQATKKQVSLPETEKLQYSKGNQQQNQKWKKTKMEKKYICKSYI